MTAVRSVYRVIRSILFATVLTVAALIILLYVVVSIPAVQDRMKTVAEKELAAYLKAPVRIGRLELSPFNELRLSDIIIQTPEGKKCVDIQRLGAGIAFWKMVLRGDIEITYAEIIGMKARIEQERKDGPLNIQFIIDAFKPKREGQPPGKFYLKLHNVVIRKSAVTFARLWNVPREDARLDPNYIAITNLRADLAMPILKNDNFKIELKRLSFREKSGLYLDALSMVAEMSPRRISVKDFDLKLAQTTMTLNDLEYDINGFASIPSKLKEAEHDIRLSIRKLDPSDFAFIVPRLNMVPGIYSIEADMHGTLEDLTINSLTLDEVNHRAFVELQGSVRGLPDVRKLTGNVSKLEAGCQSTILNDIIGAFTNLPAKPVEMIARTQSVGIEAEGAFSMPDRRALMESRVHTELGSVSLEGSISWLTGAVSGDARFATDGFEVGRLIDNQPVNFVAFNGDTEFDLCGKSLNGNVNLNVPALFIKDTELQNITLSADKSGQDLSAVLTSDCQQAKATINASCELAGALSSWDANGNVEYFNGSAFGLPPGYPASVRLGSFRINLLGNNIDNLSGEIHLNDLACNPVNGKPWELHTLNLSMDGDVANRSVILDSDILDGNIYGSFRFVDLPGLGREVLANALPSYIKAPLKPLVNQTDMAYELLVKNDDKLYDAFDVPFHPAEPVRISGTLNNSSLSAKVSAPYIIKGEDKLWKNLMLDVNADRENGLTLTAQGSLPQKNRYVNANITAEALRDTLQTQVKWDFDNSTDSGLINIGADITRNEQNKPSFNFRIGDSEVIINGAEWEVSPATAMFSDKKLRINNFRIGHGNQYITIEGEASALPTDTLVANLNDIDLSYIFDTLNINYVTFGGFATGKAIVSQLFSREPLACTRGLHVRDFRYNGAALGDAELFGRWDNTTKSVELGADIASAPQCNSKVWGNVYVTRDSLCINFDANKINIALIKPFLDNILEEVKGRASGQLQLAGTFKNIGLTGRAYADSAAVKIGYTNVWYHGSDSVIFLPDRIHIPDFTIYDRYGRTARFSGDVLHDYFHNARINLHIRDVDKLLCYDTDSKMNPVWWGRIFASGSGLISGRPGYTLVSFNGTSEPNSSFTFALDETQTAVEYNFLTFTDSHRTEETEAIEETLEEKFARKKEEKTDDEDPSIFEIDMSVALTPGIKMNVIMDPSAGDKISATGSGAMRINYNTFKDNLDVFGRYMINDGSYRFSFQDIILRDFKIQPGSSISFNGDPLRGILDLTAAYRVNTNLTDLDKSFASDRELNRSSVPVDALLKVTGDLTSPDIAFDLSLPTMTSDVERKVKSIVSSEEMLTQQVLYLLALNRFYTPQFSGGSDGELMSVASSTLSSQVSNVLSQITDKFTLNPSFKSDRNDLSDMEVDLALSSQLFDNRLIINGNLGYRDRSVSQTTFIGDFDIEYLLSKNGHLRLKAYNHFNDAYYYLKSALTTQGVGIIYRKDFDDPFAFLKHSKRKKAKQIEEKKDTVRTGNGHDRTRKK